MDRPGLGTSARVITLRPRSVTATTHLLALASSSLRGLRAGLAAEHERRQQETARQAHERALSCWSFDADHEMWVPDLLRH